MDVALPALPPKGWDGGGGDAAAFNMDSIEERMRTMKAEFEEAVLEREEGLQDIADVDGADQNGLLEPGRFGAASRPESESAGTNSASINVSTVPCALGGDTAGPYRGDPAEAAGMGEPGNRSPDGLSGVGGFSSSAAPTFRPLNSNRGILIGHAEPSGVGERVPPGAGGDSAKDKQRTWGRTSVHARAPHAPLPHRTEPAAQGARSDTSTLGGQLRADRQLLSATHPEVAAELEFRAGRAPPPFAGARARARSTAPGDAGGGAPSVLDLGAGGAELSRVDAILRDALGALQVPPPSLPHPPD